jgi:hypothetical protein
MKIGRYKRSFTVEPLHNPVPQKEHEAPQRDPQTRPETPRRKRVRTTARA